MGQVDQTQRERQRQLAASRRTKLIEESQNNRASSPVVSPKRRIVSRTRVTPAPALRASPRTTEAPVTTPVPVTEAATEALFVTEPTFPEDMNTFITDAPQEPVQELQRPEAPREEVIRGVLPSRPGFRPVLRPVVEQKNVEESVVFRPPPFRPAEPIEIPVEQPQIAEPVQEEVQQVRQRPAEQAQQSRPRPLAGPTRNRVQPTSNREQQQVDIELPSRAPALSKPNRPQSTKTTVETEEKPRKPSVETIRRYQFTSPDGSFTFGYENADGSFKEETRGADCVVNGKYGYVEEDGTRREFTYQAGNPCDPKAAAAQADLPEEEPVQAPVRRPSNTPRPTVTRPEPARSQPERPQPERPQPERSQPARPSQPERPEAAERRPSFPTFQQAQQSQQQGNPIDDEERQIQEVLNTPTRSTRPVDTRPQPAVQPRPAPQPRPASQPRPVPQQQEAPVAPQRPRPQPGASVFDQELLNFNARPSDIIQLQPAAPQRQEAAPQEEVVRGALPSRPGFRPVLIPVEPRPAPPVERPIFEEEEEVFVQRNERPRQERPEGSRPTGQRSFATELVFDPRNNQFQSATQQFIPATQEDLRFRDQLIAFSPSTTPRPEQVREQSREQAREQPREQVREQPREQAREQPREQAREQRPQFPQLNENTQVFQSPSFQEQRPAFPQFQANIGDPERIRQESEARRQQQEQQRLADERQRIAEENDRRRLQPAVVFAPQRAQATQFNAAQQFPGQFQQPRPQFQQPQSSRVVPQEARPTFASGQIDSFLSTL